MKKLRKPIIHSYDGISEQKHRIFTWKRPTCKDVNGAIINLENTGKNVECGGCGAEWRLGIKWVDEE